MVPLHVVGGPRRVSTNVTVKLCPSGHSLQWHKEDSFILSPGNFFGGCGLVCVLAGVGLGLAGNILGLAGDVLGLAGVY